MDIEKYLLKMRLHHVEMVGEADSFLYRLKTMREIIETIEKEEWSVGDWSTSQLLWESYVRLAMEALNGAMQAGLEPDKVVEVMEDELKQRTNVVRPDVIKRAS